MSAVAHERGIGLIEILVGIVISMLMVLMIYQVYEVSEVGYNQLRQVPTDQLTAGEVGYVVASVRSVGETRWWRWVVRMRSMARRNGEPVTPE